MKKLIKNVVELDLTTATEESVGDLTVNNAVAVYITPSTRHLLSKIKIKNIVETVEVPENVKIAKFSGKYILDGNTTQAERSYLFMSGRLIIKPNVTPETLKQIYCGGSISGATFVPEGLSAALAGFVINGALNTYPADSMIFDKHLVINNDFAKKLTEGTKISAFAGLTVEADNLDNIESLTVFGETILHERAKDSFYKAAVRYDDVIVIPEGYTLYDESVEIMPSNRFSFMGKSIFTKENAYLHDGISQIDFKLKTEGITIASEDTAMALADKIDSKYIYTYNGNLITIEGVRTFAGEPGNYLIKPDAELIIPKNADLTAINDIFLLGDIATEDDEQIMQLSAKLVLNKGEIFCGTSNEDEEDESDDNDSLYDVVVKNAVHYKL